MTVALLITIFAAGYCCLKWHAADEACKQLLKQNHRLVQMQHKAHQAMSPPRRLARDVGIRHREAHSHAEKGTG